MPSFIAIIDNNTGRQIARFDLNPDDARKVLGYARGISKTAQQPPGQPQPASPQPKADSPMPANATRYPVGPQPAPGQIALGQHQAMPSRFFNPKFRNAKG